jgi:hypothetical protein
VPGQLSGQPIRLDRDALLRGGADRAIAQSRGFNVSAAEVHTNPLKKVYLCQVIGFDNRLKGSCAGYGPDSFGRER